MLVTLGLLKLLRKNWRQLVAFELFYKVVSTAVLLPLMIGCFDISMRVTGYTYLTADNLCSYLLHPFTLLMLLFILFSLTFYTLFDISAIIYIFDQSYQQKQVDFLSIFIYSFHSAKKLFQGFNFSIALFVLFLLPFMNIGVASSYLSMITIPSFIKEELHNHWYYTAGFIVGVMLIVFLIIRWIYNIHYFVLEHCSFAAACRKSAKLLKKHFFYMAFCFILFEFISTLAFKLETQLSLLLFTMLGQLALSGSLLRSFVLSSCITILIVLLLVAIALSTPICYGFISISFYRFKEEIGEPIVRNPRYDYKMRPRILKYQKRVEFFAFLISSVFCIIYIFLLATGQINFNVEMLHTTEVSAHRGASALYPENSMSAFEGAVELGADWIELDVQETKDGQIIVMHDANLRRTTGINRAVWTVTYDEIKGLDCGSWFHPKFAGQRIPLLSDVLAFAKEQNIRLNIELKPTGHENNLEEKVVDLILEQNLQNDCVVTSQTYHALENVKAYNPDIFTVYVCSVAYGNITHLSDADAFSIDASFASKSLITRIHNAGKQVYVWTVNKKANIDRMIDLNVDNIITDNIILTKNCIYDSKTSNGIDSFIKKLLSHRPN